MQPGLPLPEEEAVALFSYQTAALFHCCSLKTSRAGKKTDSQQKLRAAAGQKGWGRKEAEKPKRKAAETPKCFFFFIQHPTDKRQEKSFSLLPAFLVSW